TNTQRKPRTDEKTNQVKGVQCHECEGYGHIRIECATYLKKQKKDLTVSWSDEDDSEGEVESEAAKNITALTGRYMSDTDSCDEEKKIIAQLQAERYDNLSKISELNNE
ncbi:gag-protease polyprotein, partial [Trifolium medium]|nr:gag-protease polyprotein [Trifolium medium]